MLPWMQQTIADIAAALRDGRLSAAALWDEARENHRRFDRRLNAYACWDEEQATRQAHAADSAFAAGLDLGPLQGIPVSAKDLFAIRGYPTFAGSPRRLPAAWEIEGPVIRALRHQAPVIAGKTHMVEFAFGGIGINHHWQTPRNPWDAARHRIPGGSSAGAGVSLMEGSALLALGSDTAGSIRIPASVTGCAGLKLTHGRWSLDGIVPLSPSLDTPGFLAKSAADLAYGFYALDPGHRDHPVPSPLPVAELAGLRLGMVTDPFWSDLSPGIAEAVETALRELEAKGARRTEVALPELEPAAALFRSGGLAGPELYAFLRRELPDWMPTLDPIVRQRVMAVENLTAHEYLDRAAALNRIAMDADSRLRTVDAIVSPTVALTPPAFVDLDGTDAYAPANLITLRNTWPANFLRLCAVTLPCGLDTAGMPVGLQVMMRGGEEERLLAVALAIEGTLGTAARRLGRPPLLST